MVALMVFLTVVAFVSVDLLLMQIRKRREMSVKTADSYQPDMVFAQDGGEPINEKKEDKDKE